jgi:transcriptional regulator with XRE-family HTH domain
LPRAARSRPVGATPPAVLRCRRPCPAESPGLSQEKLAEKAGCDRQSINRVENAAYSPSLDRIFKLADGLGLSLPELFHDFDEVDHPKPMGHVRAGRPRPA